MLFRFVEANEKRHDATLRDHQASILSNHTQVGQLTNFVQEKLSNLLSRKDESIPMAKVMESNQSLELKNKEEEEYREVAQSPRDGGNSATSWAIKEDYEFSVAGPYRPPIPFPSHTKENMVKQGNTMFMEHKELAEQLEKEENHSRPLMSTPMVFEVSAFTRPPDQVTKTVEEKEEEYDEPHFEKKNPERDNTKAKHVRMRKKPKLKHKDDVNPSMQETSRKAFSKWVAYKQTRLNMM
ncbi:unnamed protein product [Lactuca saligna]|uniref:Uncharacterized protein n=1 Tax=Lactuca saligna TaxID=75948 RepID=A0AA35Z831_LACSI|nr:unnamed protein product [Lactuca saligna]